MGVRGFLARLGLDSRGYSRGLDKSVDQARVAARKIRTTFETQDEKARRRERKRERERRDQIRTFQRGWQVAAVATAAGLASVATAMDAAADRSPVYRQQLEEISRASQSLRADIGEDLFGLAGPNASQGIRNLAEIRKQLVNGLLGFRSPAGAAHAATIDAARAAEASVARALDAYKSFDQLRKQLRAQDGDRDAIVSLSVRGINRRVAAYADEHGLDSRQRKELRDLAHGVRERAGDRFFEDEEDRIRLQRGRVRAQETRGISIDERERRQIGVAYFEKLDEERHAVRRINQNELINERQRLELIKQTKDAIEERYRVRLDEIKAIAQERRIAANERYHDRLQDIKIERLRANNQGRLADAERIRFDFELRRREIQRDNDLSEQRKQTLIAAEAGLASRLLRRLSDGERPEGISAGLAGGATLRRQILGGGEGRGQSPLVGRVDEIIELLTRFTNGQTQANVAVAG